MRSCEQYRAQLLEHLYGLLDEGESQAVARHLDGCAGCRDALAQAQGQKRLLAVAARSEFPNVHFEAPDEEETVALPFLQRVRSWAPLAAAAAVLLAVGLFGVPGAVYWRQDARVTHLETEIARVEKERKDVNRQYQRNLDAADQEVAALRDTVAKQTDQAPKKLAEGIRQIQDREVHLSVSGPPSVQAGAPNEFKIEAHNRLRQPVPARVAVEVKDEAQRVVYRADDLPAEKPGEYRLTLPRDLPVKPQGDLYLVVSARGDEGPASQVNEKLKLVAPLYVTHLTTDKPMYLPGEVVHFRSLTLERFSLTPAREDLRLAYTITDGKGQEVFRLEGSDQLVTAEGNEVRPVLGPDGKPVRGIGAGVYGIPPGASGGEYTLRVSEARDRFPLQTRKFLVNRYEKPRLNKELEFTARSYGPGDAVAAACKARRADGGAVADRQITATVQIDGKRLGPDGRPNPTAVIRGRTDAQGAVAVKFKLPDAIDKGEASLSVTFNDGAAVETIVRPIPIVLKKLQVEFFPEGGDLVAGVPCRVYVQAQTTLDRPAEVKGRIVDDQGKVASEAHTFNDPEHPGANQGMGVFTLTPAAGRKYELKIDSPAGIEGRYPLPDAKADGVVLAVLTGVIGDKEPLRVTVQSGQTDRTLFVGAYCRGRLMTHERVRVKKGEAKQVELKPEAGVGGVYRVTVFDEQGPEGRRELVPVAERLVYRAPAARLSLAVRPDKQRYVPGDKASLTYQATDEKGNPVAAVLMTAVVDRSVIALADDKTRRGMPTQLFLANEVRRPEDLEHADFLLTAQPSAAVALDLLLGTQGWRRFAEQDPARFRGNQKDQERKNDADRLLVYAGILSPRNGPQATDLDVQEVKQLKAEIDGEIEKLHGRLKAAQDARKAAEEAPALVAEDQRLFDQAAALGAQLTAEAQTLNHYKDLLRTYGPPLLKGFAAALLIIGVYCVAVGARRILVPQALPYLVTAACAVLLVGMVLTFRVRPADTPTLARIANPGLVMADRQRTGVAVAEAGGPQRQDPGQAVAVKPVPGAPAHVVQGVNPPRPGAGGPLVGVHVAAGPDAPPFLKEKLRLWGERRGPVNELAAIEKVLAQGQAGRGWELPMGARGPGMPPMIAAKEMADHRIVGALQEAGEAPLPPLVVREYAHRRSAAGTGRSDFAETLYWHPVLVLPQDGKAQVSFDLSDSVTSFQVVAAGHTLDGRIGAVTTIFESSKPFTLEPKLPVEVTAGDRIDVPLAVANNTADQRSVEVHVQPRNLTLVQGKTDEQLALGANARTRLVYRFQPSVAEGDAQLRFSGGQGPFSDEVVRTFGVMPDGFPVVVSRSDVLEKAAREEIVLPKEWIKGTLRCQVTMYPSTLADLQKSLEALLREPGGCFEQTSSSNYPNLLILDYLKENDQARPEVTRQAQDLLDRGYQKLVAFECQNPSDSKREGYEWFGGTAPPHEALTAYGLMEFRDMARVHDVDGAMLERTKAYLMSRRDGKGGFLRNPQAIDTFGRAPDHITNAYIVWALTESGKRDDVTKELAALTKEAATSKDPYFLALVANSLLNRGRTEEGVSLLKKLGEAQKEDGHLDAEKTSITGSGGRDLQIETTALTVLAWLKANRPADSNANVQKAVRWLGQQRGGYGGFGSTQSTILTLKALIAFTRANKKTAEAGDLALKNDGRPLAEKHFEAGTPDAVTLDLPDAEKHLKPGKNSLAVEVTGKNAFPYTVTVSYRTPTPLSDAGCALRLQTRLDRETATEGETIRLTAVVENRSGQGQGMAVAVVGLPAGLSLPEDMKQLKDLVRLRNNGTEPGPASAWETRGRELVLYWRDMAPEKKVEVNLDLVCRVPGAYRGPASRAYLYYNADHKFWAEPLAVKILPKALEK